MTALRGDYDGLAALDSIALSLRRLADMLECGEAGVSLDWENNTKEHSIIIEKDYSK